MLINVNIWIYVFLLILIKVSDNVMGLDKVDINVPTAVKLGGNTIISCESDLVEMDLYQVKWYKGKREFFRFTSKEIPSIKIFPRTGIHVNIELSNASHVVLNNVDQHTSGKFSCEVTEAAPSFHTLIVSKDMNVIDAPKDSPQIVNFKPFYGADEFLEVECISNYSLPAATLEWLINDKQLGTIHPPSTLNFSTENQLLDTDTYSKYQAATSKLKLLLGHEHFSKGKLKLTCIARVLDVYEDTATEIAEENYPQIRVLSKSDNGVHFSFMSDKDERGSSSCSTSSSIFNLVLLLVIGCHISI